MPIEIIEDPVIRVTKSQLEKLSQEYEKLSQMMLNPPSFEVFVQNKVNKPCQIP